MASKAPVTRTVHESFCSAVARNADGDFLCVPSREGRDYLPGGASITYREAQRHVEMLANRYRKSGITARRIASLLESRPGHFLNLLAVNATGNSLVPLNPDSLHHEVQDILERSDVALVVVAGARSRLVREVAATLNIPVVDADDLPSAFSFREAREQCTRSPDELEAEALVIFTSGTTGRPKGCVISNRCCLEAGLTYASIGGRLTLREASERLYVPLPTYHTNATVIAFNAMLETASCLILPDRFSASSWWPDIRETRATAVHYLGNIPPALLKRPASDDDRRHDVRFGLGAGIAPELHGLFEERFGFPLVEVWGMTETGRMVADAHEPRRIQTRAFGKPSPPFEARVVDEEDRDVEAGHPGELVVRCAGVDPRSGFFSGYLGEEAATEHVWRGGWFHTGDIVTRDQDGVLYFVERRKNIIRRSGENISAAEVEGVLETDPEIAKVAVIGVTDELRDEEVMACIVDSGEVSTDAERAARIVDRARSKLAHFKLPGWIAFVADIPVTGTQKVRKGLIFPGHPDPRAHPRAIDCRSLKAKGS